MHIKVILVLTVLVFLSCRFVGEEAGLLLKRYEQHQAAIIVWSSSSFLGSKSSAGRVGLIYWMGDGVEQDTKKARIYLSQGIDGGGDIRYFLYALADIDISEGPKERGVATLERLCSENFSGACRRLEIE